MNPGDIDPASARAGRFARVTRGTSAHLEHMRQAALRADGAFQPKVRMLAAMLWSIAERCEPCIDHYARAARALGATEEEVGDFLALAGMLGGCVGETWARKAWAAYRRDETGSGCCADDQR